MPQHHRHLVVLENTPTVHNVICCTLCSCTAFTIIGLPPDWYKDLEYRARVVRESRTVLKEMGLDLAAGGRDPRLGHDGRHALHGAAGAAAAHRRLDRGAARGDRHARFDDRRRAPVARRTERMDGIHDLGGRQGFGRGALHADAHGLPRAVGECASTRSTRSRCGCGIFNMDEYRHAIERMEPRHYLTASYYERSLTSLATLCVEKGVVTREELERRARRRLPARAAERARARSNVADARALQRRRPRARARPTTSPATCACPATSAASRRRRRRVAGLSVPGRARARRRGAGRADLRRALPQRGPVAELGRPGARPRRRVPELPRAGAGGLARRRLRRLGWGRVLALRPVAARRPAPSRYRLRQISSWIDPATNRSAALASSCMYSVSAWLFMANESNSARSL